MGLCEQAILKMVQSDVSDQAIDVWFFEEPEESVCLLVFVPGY